LSVHAYVWGGYKLYSHAGGSIEDERYKKDKVWCVFRRLMWVSIIAMGVKKLLVFTLTRAINPCNTSTCYKTIK